MIKSTPYKTTDYLNTPDDISAYIEAAMEDGDPVALLTALRNVADVTGGMTALSRETKLSRESLYTSLSNKGNPRLSSLESILKAFGLQLTVRPISQ